MSISCMVGAVGIELLNKLIKSHVFTVLPTANQMNWSQLELTFASSTAYRFVECFGRRLNSVNHAFKIGYRDAGMNEPLRQSIIFAVCSPPVRKDCNQSKHADALSSCGSVGSVWDSRSLVR